MQATQSKRASGVWRRNGQFAPLRYVSRHLEIDARGDVGGPIEQECGSRLELLRAGDEPSPIKGDIREDAVGEGEDWGVEKPVSRVQQNATGTQQGGPDAKRR